MSISTSDKVSRMLDFLLAELGDLTPTNKRVAASEERLFRDYLRDISSYRHRTASRLGAVPTGYLERAAESPEGTADANSVTISLGPRAAFARAFGKVVITPKNGKKWLTIPAHRAAYGRRAGTVPGLEFVLIRKDLAALVGRAKSDGKTTVYYWLKPSVTQEQDRTLLPSDQAITEVAVEAVKDHFIEVAEKGGNL